MDTCSNLTEALKNLNSHKLQNIHRVSSNHGREALKEEILHAAVAEIEWSRKVLIKTPNSEKSYQTIFTNFHRATTIGNENRNEALTSSPYGTNNTIGQEVHDKRQNVACKNRFRNPRHLKNASKPNC